MGSAYDLSNGPAARMWEERRLRRQFRRTFPVESRNISPYDPASIAQVTRERKIQEDMYVEVNLGR